MRLTKFKISKQNLLFIAVLVVSFFIYLFFRQDLLGYDSYAFASALCGSAAYPALTGFAYLSWVPCSFFAMKATLFLLFLGFFAGLIALVKVFDKERAVAGAFVATALSPLVLLFFFSFENDAIALVLAVWGLFFLVFKTNKWGIKAIASIIGLMFFYYAGLVWGETTYLMLALIPWAPAILILVIPILFLYHEAFLSELFYFKFGVLESRLMGFSSLLFLPITLYKTYLEDKRMLLSFLILLGLCFFNARLFIFLIPFFAIYAAKFIKILDAKDVELKTFLFALCIVLALGWGYIGLVSEPTQSDWELIDQTIATTNSTGFTLYNDWDYGHWLIYKGLYTKYNGGPWPNFEFEDINRPYVALTSQEIPCELVNENKTFFRRVGLYVCR
jgi:hypothetical protein